MCQFYDGHKQPTIRSVKIFVFWGVTNSKICGVCVLCEQTEMK